MLKFQLTFLCMSCTLKINPFFLMQELLAFDPQKRLTALEALNHPYFNVKI